MSGTRPPIFGRDEQLALLIARIESDAAIVTVVGAPGVGKSRLAREALRRAEVSSTIVCDLAGVRDAAGFWGALVRTMRLETDAAPVEAVCIAVRRKEPIVLLDGFDHLVAKSADTLRILSDAAPAAMFVVTSRERLNVPGEECIVVEPLEPSAAMAMFADSAPTPPAQDRAVVEALLARLDYNPLAIELAAARLRTFTPADLLERLDRRFALLKSRSGSLSETIALSWELLGDGERLALSRATVFEGGFDLRAAEAIIALDDAWTLDVIEALVDKSLLIRAGHGRFGLSESIRAFVEEQEFADAPIETHAQYYAGYAQGWSGRAWTAADVEAATYDVPNLIVALDRTAVARPELAARLAVALDALLRHRGQTSLHFEVLDRGIASSRSSESSALAPLLAARAELASVTGALAEAEAGAEEASEIAEDVQDWATYIAAEVQRADVERRTGRARSGVDRLIELRADERPIWPLGTRRYVDANLASCLVDVGQTERARDVLQKVAPPDADAPAPMEFLACKRLAYAHYYLGNYEQQRRLNEAALALAERVGDRRRVARARQGIGDAAFARGEYRVAREHYEAALREHRELGNEHLTGVLLGNLGAAEHRADALDSAAVRYHEALALHRRAGARPYEAVVNFSLGVLEHERGHLDDAAFYYDRAATLSTELGLSEDVVATRVAQAWLEVARGTPAEGLQYLDAAESGDWATIVEQTRCLCEQRAPKQRFAARGPGNVALLAGALDEVLHGEPITASGALRVTLQGRLLLSLVADVPATVARAAVDLTIGPDGEWFQTSGEEVNLRRRKAHRRVLAELGRRHPDGEPLDVYEAFDLGWPGESIEPEAAAERVYWVIGVLRRLGLERLLLTSDEGYYLDPTATVRHAD